MTTELRVPIRTESDIVVARQHGRAMAAEVGFKGSDLTVIATTISEVARNIVKYAKHGEIRFQQLSRGQQTGLLIVAHDDGPGIEDVSLALQDGYSTSNSLGLGLPGAKRLMDEFEIVSSVGVGTTVMMKKWNH